MGNWGSDVFESTYSMPAAPDLRKVAHRGKLDFLARSEVEPPRVLQDALLGRVWEQEDGTRVTTRDMKAELDRVRFEALQ